MPSDRGAQTVKIGLAEDLIGLNLQSAFPEFYPRPDCGRLLALCGLDRYISVEFPDIASRSA
jgi:hypothetical protein